MEPTSNGLGSDCFALVWIEKDQKLYGLNASGVAPMALSADKVRELGFDQVPKEGWLPTMVPGAHHITVQSDLAVDQVQLKAGDMVVLPGGGAGVENLAACPGVETLVRQAAADELVWVAAICAAPTLLAHWGLLNGKKAVCYPGLENRLTGAIPQQGVSLVQDGKVITAQGPGSAFDFGFYLIKTLAGAAREQEVHHGTYYC